MLRSQSRTSPGRRRLPQNTRLPGGRKWSQSRFFHDLFVTVTATPGHSHQAASGWWKETATVTVLSLSLCDSYGHSHGHSHGSGLAHRAILHSTVTVTVTVRGTDQVCHSHGSGSRFSKLSTRLRLVGGKRRVTVRQSRIGSGTDRVWHGSGLALSVTRDNSPKPAAPA
jgi:hypothetical protein